MASELLIGTYTETLPHVDGGAEGILSARFDGERVTDVALADDGALGERVAYVQHDGNGPDPDRQTSPHVHQLSFDPVSGELAVVDLGLGEVRFFAFGAGGELTLRPEASIVLGAAGPRHLAFHPDGRHAFVVNELDNTVDVLRRESASDGIDGAQGDRFAVSMGASTRPADAQGDSAVAAVRVSRDGRTVLVSNRGDDTVAVLAFDQAASAVELVAAVPAEVLAPRDLVLSPDGTRVLVAGQNSGEVAVFAFDEDGRTLDFVSRTPVPTPVCLHFV